MLARCFSPGNASPAAPPFSDTMVVRLVRTPTGWTSDEMFAASNSSAISGQNGCSCMVAFLVCLRPGFCVPARQGCAARETGRSGKKTESSPALLELHGNFQGLAVAQHGDFDDLTNL